MAHQRVSLQQRPSIVRMTILGRKLLWYALICLFRGSGLENVESTPDPNGNYPDLADHWRGRHIHVQGWYFPTLFVLRTQLSVRRDPAVVGRPEKAGVVFLDDVRIRPGAGRECGLE